VISFTSALILIVGGNASHIAVSVTFSKSNVYTFPTSISFSSSNVSVFVAIQPANSYPALSASSISLVVVLFSVNVIISALPHHVPPFGLIVNVVFL